MNTVLMANIIGVFLYPLTYYQFSSSSKKHFLLLNFVTCILFAVSLWLTDQNTAALISGIAGVTSLFQINKASLSFKIGIAVISIAVTVWMAFPVTIFAWLAILIYSWNRFAETQDQYAMRLMFLLSPLAWMLLPYFYLCVGYSNTEIKFSWNQRRSDIISSWFLFDTENLDVMIMGSTI